MEQEKHLLVQPRLGENVDDKKWAEFYSSDRENVSKIFVKVMTTDFKHFFFSEYDQWYAVKEHCENNSVFVKDLHLQFRSHKIIIEIRDCEGVYLVRSAMGAVGQPTKNYYTVGLLKDDGLVHKQMWLVPELILDKEFEDKISSCFSEAMIYNGKKKEDRKE